MFLSGQAGGGVGVLLPELPFHGLPAWLFPSWHHLRDFGAVSPIGWGMQAAFAAGAMQSVDGHVFGSSTAAGGTSFISFVPSPPGQRWCLIALSAAALGFPGAVCVLLCSGQCDRPPVLAVPLGRLFWRGHCVCVMEG